MKCLLSKGALRREAEGQLPGGASGPKLHLHVRRTNPGETRPPCKVRKGSKPARLKFG